MTAPDFITNLYKSYPAKIAEARQALGRPLTLTEKILCAHFRKIPTDLQRKATTVGLYPDRVAMQDATAQMAILQFMSSGINTVQVPSTVHCDHLIQARRGADADMATATSDNREVYDFLKTASQRYGIGFWKPGAGIIHQVVLENYAFPGGMMIGTDSHTPNAGGLGMIAIGVGGADAVDVMVGEPFGLRWPGVIGVKLTGKLSGWASPKDVILKLMSILTVKGGTGHIVEYFGEGTKSLSCTGKGTICNMGAEHGATTSVFPYDANMAAYLKATGRADWATLAESVSEHLRADDEVMNDPAKYYDRVVEINLSELEPNVAGPHTPDLVRPISVFAEEIKKEGWPEEITFGLIGSCTNSSYEDMGRSASIINDAASKGLSLKVPLGVSPGSEQIFNTIGRDGQMASFEKVGATVLANACGPCIGQWKRDDIKPGQVNAIINSYNRNFKGRNDGNAETLSFIASPELVTAVALSGKLGFNPMKDTITNAKGEQVKLAEPHGDELPAKGFEMAAEGFVAPAVGGGVDVVIPAQSDRLQKLSPFAPWDGKDFSDLAVLLKAKGKCTTDHISPAGVWLKCRGHLDNISNNMFLGAVNAFTGEAGKAQNIATGESGKTYAEIARDYKARGISWLAIGDENYGEGSSREHAAMSPRHLGAKAVIVKSFARIHETNLKKQGVLPFTFATPADYDRITSPTDKVSITGLSALAPGKPVTAIIRHEDGKEEHILLNHTLTDEQIAWFKAGSALNKIAQDLIK